MKDQTTIGKGDAIRWEALQSIAKVVCPKLTAAYKRGGLDSYRLEGSIIAEIKQLQEQNKKLAKETNLLKAKIETLSHFSLLDFINARQSPGGKT